MTETPVAGPHGRATRLARRPLDLLRGLGRAFPRAIEDLFRDRCPQYAAAIAFHVLFSLFPLTILLVSIFGLVLQDDELRADVLDELLAVLPVSESGEQDVRTSIEEIASPLSAIGLISSIALLWGASGMMASIRVGLEAAFKVERGRPAAHAKLRDFLVVGATGLLVLLVLGLSAFAAFFSRAVDPITEAIGVDAALPTFLLRDGFQLGAFAVMTLLLYRFVPAGRPRVRGWIAGAILTAIGIWGAAKLLAIFFDFSRYNVIYGSLAGVTTFLFFVYVVALILLFGAEFAYAWSEPAEPGPPLGTQIKGFLRGLVRHPETTDGPGSASELSEERARRP